jgi:hypothetical protein
LVLLLALASAGPASALTAEPSDPDEVISEVEVRRWVRVGDIVPGTFDQKNVHDLGNGRGVIRLRKGVPGALWFGWAP